MSLSFVSTCRNIFKPDQRGLSLSACRREVGSLAVMMLALLLPLSVAAASIVAVLLVLCWIAEGNLNEKIREVRSNKVALAFLAFFALNLLGLLWTQNMKWGFHITAKHWKFLLMPIVLTLAKREHLQWYAGAFVLSMVVAVVVSYLNWLGIIHYCVMDNDPVAFMNHISYNVLLAFAIYLVLYALLFLDLPKGWKVTSLCLILLMSINMFITGGRAGQVGFMALIMLICCQYFSNSIFKALLVSGIVIPLILGASYMASRSFRERVVMAVEEVRNYERTDDSSVGNRVVFLINSMALVQSHPVLGVGTGDFPDEYAEVNRARSPNTPYTVNPHNEYVLVLAQFGLIGLAIFISIFYFQLKYALESPPPLRHLRMALPVLFLVIMLSESYLMVHFTSLMFCTFSGIFYKDYDGRPAVAAPADRKR